MNLDCSRVMSERELVFCQNCALRGLHVTLERPSQTKIKSTHWKNGAVCIVQDIVGSGKIQPFVLFNLHFK